MRLKYTKYILEYYITLIIYHFIIRNPLLESLTLLVTQFGFYNLTIGSFVNIIK